MKLLITGAAGRLGSVVTHHLNARGHEVRATDRRYRPGLPVRLELADLTDPHAAYRLLEGVEAVVHLGNLPNAAAAPAQQLLADNTAINANVFVAARELAVKRIVFASTIQAFLDPIVESPDASPSRRLPYLPIDGDAPVVLHNNEYALSKIFAEQMLLGMTRRDPELVCTIFRFPFLPEPKQYWGMVARKPSGRRERAARLTTQLIRGRPSPGEAHKAWAAEGLTYLKLTDAASVIEAALASQGPGYHCYFPAQSFAVEDMTTQEVIAWWLADVPPRDPGTTPDRIVDLDRLASELHWSPPDAPGERALPW